MNYRGFKKVHEDSDKAILKNNHGHSITIAKKSLAQKHLDGLKNLPLYAAEGADTNVDDDPTIPADENQGVVSTPTPMQPVQSQPISNPSSPEGIASSDAPVQQEQIPQPIALTVGHPDLPPQQHAAAVYQDMNQQAIATAKDLGNGHITPKTYGDLFAKKDTLGKIGTLFGLLVAGAGSGMIGQENPVLKMMNQELDRDLDAQKQSKANQVNFLNMNLRRLKNDSDIALQGSQAGLAKAQTGVAYANSALIGAQAAKTGMLLSAMQDLFGITAKMPPGAGKVAASNALNQAGAAVQQHIQNGNAQTAAQVSKNSESAYNLITQKLKVAGALGEPGLGELAKDREAHMIPGIGTSKVPLNQQDRDKVLKMSNFESLLREAADLNDKLGRRGGWTDYEKKRATQVHNDIVSSYNDVKGLTRFTGNEEALYSEIVPNLGKVNLWNQNKNLLGDLRNSVGAKKDILYKQLGITPFDSDAQAPNQKENSVTSGLKEGQTGTSKSGRPTIIKNGKMVYQ